MECVSCTRGLDHCHGTLIVHTSEFTECTDMTCGDHDTDRHPLIVDCATVDGGCDCVTVTVGELVAHDHVA